MAISNILALLNIRRLVVYISRQYNIYLSCSKLEIESPDFPLMDDDARARIPER